MATGTTMNEIRDRLRAIEGEYNAAVDAGKIRAIRNAATQAHHAVCQVLKELELIPSAEDVMTEKAESMLMDIRWGRRTTQVDN